MESRVALMASSLCKSYGGVHAVVDFSLTLHRGEIVALVGDNGAGKSTVLKMLAGAVRPDRGDIAVGGQRTVFKNSLQASDLGIGVVWQELGLAPMLDVSGNIFLGRELTYPWLPGPVAVLKRRVMADRARALLEELEVTIPPRSFKAPVMHLSGGQQQAIAIARATAWASEVLLLDEPTAALGVRESLAALELVERMAHRGLGVLMITHNVSHVMAIADRAVVIRQGNKIGELAGAGLQEEAIVGMIAGTDSARKTQDTKVGGCPDGAWSL